MDVGQSPNTAAATGSMKPASDLLPRLYDRAGHDIDFDTWIRLHLQDEELEYVARQRVGPDWVATLWFGIDPGTVTAPHQHTALHRPAVFRRRSNAWARSGSISGSTSALSTWPPDRLRYATEADALAGHEEAVARLAEDSRSATPEQLAVTDHDADNVSGSGSSAGPGSLPGSMGSLGSGIVWGSSGPVGVIVIFCRYRAMTEITVRAPRPGHAYLAGRTRADQPQSSSLRGIGYLLARSWPRRAPVRLKRGARRFD
jgi:hypothetical protein